MTAATLNTIHNLYFYLDLMRRIRLAIEEDRFAAFLARFENRTRRARGLKPPARCTIMVGCSSPGSRRSRVRAPFSAIRYCSWSLIFGVFYLIVVRPMRKKQLQTETMLGELKNGDRVLTSGGIYGTVVGVNDDHVQFRVADHVKIQVAKSAITQLVEDSSKRRLPAIDPRGRSGRLAPPSRGWHRRTNSWRRTCTGRPRSFLW